MNTWHAKTASTYLNQYVTSLQSDDVSFEVHYWGVQPEHYDNPVHRHSFFEVCYVVDGEGSYSEEDTLYPLYPGVMFYSRPGTFHQIRSEVGLYLLFVAFELSDESSDQRSQQFFNLLNNEQIYATEPRNLTTAFLWKALVNQTESATKSDIADIQKLASLLLCSLPSCFMDKVTSDHKDKTELTGSQLLKQAKLYIEDNLAQPLTMDMLAKHLHISERHLGRLFSTETGQTFSHYLQEKRVQKARTLMDTTTLPLSEIAIETGFKTIHYFTRVFTQKLGIPPGKYRSGNFPAYPRKNKRSH